MEQSVCQTSVICEEYESWGILIQTPNREDSGRCVDDVYYALAISLCTGCFYATRLIDSVVDERLTSGNEIAWKLYFILFWIDRLTDVGNDTIHDDLSIADGEFTGSARADARFWEIFLETEERHKKWIMTNEWWRMKDSLVGI